MQAQASSTSSSKVDPFKCSAAAAAYVDGLSKVYEGRSIFEVNDSWNGHGQQIWKARYELTEIRMDTDGREYMLINIISKIESVPADANAKVKLAAEPQCHIALTYLYEVNRAENTLLKLGGDDIMDRTTAPEGTWSVYNYFVLSLATYLVYYINRGRQRGVRSMICGWSFLRASLDDQDEMKLTNKGKVILSTTGAWANGDITTGLRVLFASKDKPLCPAWSSLNGREVDESSDAIISEFNSLFAGSMFRRPDDRSRPLVEVSYNFERLSYLDTLAELFKAELSLIVTWDVTIFDVVDYIARSSHERDFWEPKWKPPQLHIYNAGSDAADIKFGLYSLTKTDGEVFYTC